MKGAELMKKRILTVITAAICGIGAVPALTASGISLSPPDVVSCLKGDANLDSRATVADSVAILQHIANRDKYCLKAQGLVNADVDGVAGVTANDALELQKRDSLRAAEGEEEAPDNVFYSVHIDWTMNTRDYADDIWDKIRGGYSGVLTSTEELRAYLSEICNESLTDEYAAKYSDEFFAENVLFMNALSQSSGGECMLMIDSVDTGDTITVNAPWTYEGGTAAAAVMSVCLGQVVFPKAAYSGQEVVWTHGRSVVPPVSDVPDVCKKIYTSRVDYTMGYSGFKNAMKQGSKIRRNGYDAVITSSDELKAYLTEACTDEKIEEYTAKYTDDFFTENVLFMNIIEQYQGTRPCLHIDNIDFGDTITVNADWDYSGACATIMSVCVGVVELDREAYKGQPVVWTCNNVKETPLPPEALSFSAKTDWYCDTGKDMQPEVWEILDKGDHSAVITSPAELEEYLSPIFRKELVQEYLKFYEGYFDGCVILMNCELQGSGGECRLKVDSADYSDDRTEINVRSSWQDEDKPQVEMMSVCLQQLKVQKEQYTGQTVNWTTT